MRVYFINDLHWDFWKKTHSLDKFFDDFFLPADVCCIAGDIANYYEQEIEILQYLKSRYTNIVYVVGNHDLGIFKKDIYKSNIISSNTKKNKLSNIIQNQLDGNIVKLNDITFGGTCGSCDWSWALENFNTNQQEFLSKWNNWFDGYWWKMQVMNPKIIFDAELEKMKTIAEQKPNIFVTHFQPKTCPIADMYKNDIMTGMFVFDDSKLNLPEGTIYHYGHTHSKFKKEINGILYLNNVVGYPEEICLNALGNYNKEDFLLDL